MLNLYPKETANSYTYDRDRSYVYKGRKYRPCCRYIFTHRAKLANACIRVIAEHWGGIPDESRPVAIRAMRLTLETVVAALRALVARGRIPPDDQPPLILLQNGVTTSPARTWRQGHPREFPLPRPPPPAA